MIRRRHPLLAGMLVLLCSTACSRTQTGKDRPGVRETFEHPEAVCAGRLRMTVPGPGTYVHYTQAYLNGVYLETEGHAPGTTFAGAWEAHQQQLAKTRVLLKPYRTGTGRVGVAHRQKTDYPPASELTTTLEVWQDMGTFTLKAQTPIPAASTAARTAAAEQALTEVLDRYHAGGPAAKEAFCVDRGWIDLRSKDGEGIKADVMVPVAEAATGKLDLSLITEVVNQSAADGLLARIDGALPGLRASGRQVKVLRHGERTVAGMHGHEYVDVVTSPESRGRYLFSAYFEFGGTGDSVTEPAISLQIAPTYFPDSVGPDGLVKLWDALLNGMHH